MHFSDLIDLGKVIMLFIFFMAIVAQTCDRFMIFCVKPPGFWFRSLQKRADSAVARFTAVYATAEAEGNKHYQSSKLHHALLSAHVHLLSHDNHLPWFYPFAFVEELEEKSRQGIAQLEKALAYQQTPEFMLEAAAHLRAARDEHPERLAAHIRQVEKDFQQSLKRLQEAKENALKKGYAWHDERAQAIEEQLVCVETNLQLLTAGTTINTTNP